VSMGVHENKAAASSSRRRRDGPDLPHSSQEMRHIQPVPCVTDNSCYQCTLPTGRFYRSSKEASGCGLDLPPRTGRDFCADDSSPQGALQLRRPATIRCESI
jgi:hypothetical protein